MKSEKEQPALFDAGEKWEEAWGGMPEFVQKDLKPFHTIYVHFENREDMEAFSKLVNQTINLTTQSIWYPEAEQCSILNKRYVTPDTIRGAPVVLSDERKNDFVRDAEDCEISTAQWVELLNMILSRGASIEQAEEFILKRYGSKIRHLKISQYSELIEEIKAKSKI
jgi:hypothetical protein